MGATSRGAQKAGDAARAATSNPYLRRLIEDEELRDNIRVAFEAAKNAYQRVSNGRGPANTVVDDKKFHRDLRTAAESLRDATDKIRGKRRRRGGIGRWVLLAIIGAGLVLVLSEEARNAVLDKLFGAEEEFEYTSTTTPDQPSVPTS